MNDNYYYDPDEDLDLLSDEEKEFIKQESMHNTYTLVTNNYDFDVFPERSFWLLTDYNEVTVFDVLMDYYAHPDREDYEKCAILRDIYKRLKRRQNNSVAKRGKFIYKIKSDDEKLL